MREQSRSAMSRKESKGLYMSRKALFFDVDGTLFSEITKQVPQSAVLALNKAREHGHLVFINTGRVFCHVGPIKSQVEADGYVCGCGSYIAVGSQVLYSVRIPHARGMEIKRDIVRFGLDGILEGIESCYMQKKTSSIPGVERLRGLIGEAGNISPYGWEEDCYEFDKFCVLADENSDRKGFFETLKPDFDVIDRGGNFYECVPAGHSKGSGIDLILKHFQIPLEDAYVFGDSMNDLSMFQYAKNGILMGRHDAELEPYASFVTRTVEEDGIAYAMNHLGLI